MRCEQLTHSAARVKGVHQPRPGAVVVPPRRGEEADGPTTPLGLRRGREAKGHRSSSKSERTQAVKGRRGESSSAQTYYAHTLLPHLRPPVHHRCRVNNTGRAYRRGRRESLPATPAKRHCPPHATSNDKKMRTSNDTKETPKETKETPSPPSPPHPIYIKRCRKLTTPHPARGGAAGGGVVGGGAAGGGAVGCGVAGGEAAGARAGRACARIYYYYY